MRPLLLIALIGIGASVARTIVGGQDLNFDLQVYHYYLGYSAFVDRFALDFLPAGFQGYQSPLPYVLLYWLDSVGTPPVVNASIHASIHALNLVLLFLLAQRLVGENATTGRDRVTVLAFWSLGAVAPAYWHLVGTSYADLLTSVLVLGALWLIARGGVWSIAAGAALAGVAVGLRVHCAIYVAGLFCALALTRLDRLRTLGVFCAAAFSGWILCFAPWALRVYREFGNPLFPFYNAVFRSPDFPAANLPLTNFVPDNFRDLVLLPFRMAGYEYWVYVETRLPDVRPALLVVSLAACGLLWLFRRRAFDGRTEDAGRLILAFFAVSGILWLFSSSNGRYGVALFLLGGPVCGVLLSRLMPFRYMLAAVAGVLAWQILLQGMLYRESRIVSTPWASRYFDWNLPDRYRREPATFLSFALQTGSTLAPLAHPGSSHANLVGQYTPAIDRPGSDRIRKVIARPQQRLYGVFDFDYTESGEPGANSIKTYFRDHLRLWGLDFADGPCEAVSLRPGVETAAWLKRATDLTIHAIPPSFIVCELRPSVAEEHERAVAGFASFKRKLESFGAACPQHFGKPFSYTRVYRRWIVAPYASYEWRLDVEDEGVVKLMQSKPPNAVLPLGRATREAIVATEPDCDKWFSRLAEIAARERRE